MAYENEINEINEEDVIYTYKTICPRIMPIITTNSRIDKTIKECLYRQVSAKVIENTRTEAVSYNMNDKPTAVYSISSYSCPRCHTEYTIDIFEIIRNMKYCPVCGQRLKYIK